MIIILPKWWSKAEEKLDKVIKDIAEKNNIDFWLVDDSKIIEDCKEGILNRLMRIEELQKGDKK